MHHLRHALVCVCTTAGILLNGAIPGMGAEPVAEQPVVQIDPEATPMDRWEFEFRPYAWVLFLTGKNTLGRHNTNISTNLFEIVGEADRLYAFMSYQEARYGRVGLFADVFWSRINVGTSTVRTASPIAGLDVTLVADADVWLDMAIVEPGVTYEIASWSGGSHPLEGSQAFVPTTALDVIAGARYWYLNTDIDLSLTGDVSIPALGLTRIRGRTLSGEKTIDWWDPYVGLRLRHQTAPGRDAFVRADVGGFGAGSDLTWQAVAGYSFDTRIFGLPIAGHVGYRALYIDYEQGSGSRRFGLDLLQHGPIIGASFKW
jgi:hypothetical protein